MRLRLEHLIHEAAELIVHCRERIGYKAPEEILFLDEMPLNPTGKVDRKDLERNVFSERYLIRRPLLQYPFPQVTPGTSAMTSGMASWLNSGSASGMVDSSCAAFISGPFSPPSARPCHSRGWAWTPR